MNSSDQRMIEKWWPPATKFESENYRTATAMAFEDFADLIESWNPKAALACRDVALAANTNDAVAFLRAKRKFRHEILCDKITRENPTHTES